MSSTDRVLITGATSGIGAEFARQLGAAGHDLVLVARDTARLAERAAEISDASGVEVETLTADLFTDEGIAAVEARLRSAESPIGFLVNNAGYGLPLEFETNDIADELRHLRLHVEVPMRLTHAALGVMLPRGEGTIVNVASVAGYTPRGTYSAVKAWSLNFSRWAHWAYRDRGVRVMALAPGFVHTEFHQRMGTAAIGVPRFMWLDVSYLVRVALHDLERGRAVSIPSVKYKVAAWAAKWVPDGLVARVARMGR